MPTSKKTIVLTILVLTCILLVVAVYTYRIWSSAPRESAITALQNSEAVDFTDLEGNPFSFAVFDGVPFIVNSWASWTPFSKQELTDFNQLAEEYKDRGVHIVALNRAEPVETVKSYLATVPATDALTFVQNPTDSFYVSIGGFAMPETVFYNSDGEVVFHKRGFMTKDEMQARITAILE